MIKNFNDFLNENKKYEITNALVVFLDKHKLNAKEMKDFDYVSSLIHNYAENIDIEFSDEEAIDLAKQYLEIKNKK